jgi:hypothetical protein
MASAFAQSARVTASSLVASSATYVLVVGRLLSDIDNSRLRLLFGVLPNEYEAMLSSRGEIAAYLEFA